ncbi:hypothetical protein AB4Z29_26920 [Paenibacillus sp. 2TAB23]|uniref:hypothetical protein n=1 Tax=Paenibacillus sp. 2TAB23 TaxID=3233004 RepID=UPI003F9DF7A1
MNDSFELEIIPGIRVGKYHLRWNIDELISKIDFEYEIVQHNKYEMTVIESNDFWFTLNKTKGLYNIYAKGNYKGMYNNLVGIGSVLNQISGLKYEIDEEFLYDTMWWRFKPTNVKGIHFVPDNEWDDSSSIHSIHVFF